MTTPSVTEPAAPEPPGLKLSEVLTFFNQQTARVDVLWQRVLYAHGALAAVMTFFATSADVFAVPRAIVFFLYTANTLVSWRSFDEAYRAMDAAVAELRQRKSGAPDSPVLAWVVTRGYRRHSARRAVVLAVVWLVVVWLLLKPLLPI